jgi:branched-chain amino acid transport system permease protein
VPDSFGGERHAGEDTFDDPEGGAVRFNVTDDCRRARLTVLFRPVLYIPHAIFLRLWGLAAFAAWLVAWVFGIVAGRTPSFFAPFLTKFIHYSLHVRSYRSLASEPYPAFSGEATYPVDVELPPQSPMSRLDFFLRPVYAFGFLIAAIFLNLVGFLIAIVGGIIALVIGRMPRDLRNLQVIFVGFEAQMLAYAGFLDDAMPTLSADIQSSAAAGYIGKPRTRELWWHSLDAVGMPESRWQGFTPLVRRAIIAGVAGVLLLLVLGPLTGIDISAVVTYFIFVFLYVPSWERFGRFGRWVLPVAFLALAATFPYYAGSLYTVPILGQWPDVHTATVMLVYVMMALGLNVVVGYAGLLDLGYVAFYAIGAYTAAALASTQFAGQLANGNPARYFNFGGIDVDKSLGGIHISVWLLLLVAGVFTALLGMLIGLPTLRLRGDYLAIVTLGFGEILPQIARNGDNFFNTGINVTNGPQGITSMDAIGFGGWLHRNLGLPENYLNAANSDNLFFWTAIVLVCFTLFCCLRLRDSRLGRAWIAIREDETAAAAMGVPLMRTKTFAYAIGAFFGGVAGAYYAELTTGANPDSFQFQFSVLILVMVILGGMGNVWGVMFGAAFLAYLDQAGLANTGAWLNGHLGTNFDVQKYEFGIYGVILLVVMLFRPQGLIPEKRHKLEMELGVHDEYLYDVSGAPVS